MKIKSTKNETFRNYRSGLVILQVGVADADLQLEPCRVHVTACVGLVKWILATVLPPCSIIFRYGNIHFPRYILIYILYINLTVMEGYADILILLSAGLLVEVLQVAVVFITSENAVERGAWGLCIVI